MSQLTLQWTEEFKRCIIVVVYGLNDVIHGCCDEAKRINNSELKHWVVELGSNNYAETTKLIT